MSKQDDPIIPGYQDSYSKQMSSCLRALIVKNLVVILCFSIVIALFTYVCLTRLEDCSEFLGNLLSNIYFYVPAVFACLTPFFVNKEVGGFYYGGNDRRPLDLVVLLLALGVYFYTQNFVEYSLAYSESNPTTITNPTKVETITLQNLEEVKRADYIQLKHVNIEDTKSGTTNMIEKPYGLYETRELYQIFQIESLPHVYLGAKIQSVWHRDKKISEDKDLLQQSLHDIVVHPVTDEYTYNIYNEAVRQCERVRGSEERLDFVVFELQSEPVKRPINPLWIIIGILLGGNILMYIVCVFTGLRGTHNSYGNYE